MERHAKIYWFALAFCFLFVSVKAGGICSKCRQAQIALEPRPVVPRLDLKLVLSYPIGDGALRKKRIKRHTKIAVQKALHDHLQAEIHMHEPKES